MRLTPPQVLQGLLHDDGEVRQRCLDYFADAYSRDESVMPFVARAIDAHGSDSFENIHKSQRLAQSDATIEWLVHSLRQTPQFFPDPTFIDFRPGVLLGASGRLLQRHADEIKSVLTPERCDDLNRRLQFLSESPQQLWQRLIALCEQYRSAKDWSQFPHGEVEDLVATLAESGSVPIDEMMRLLPEEVPDDEDSAIAWLEPYLIELAGLIRHQPALPVLLDKLRLNADLVSEECEVALIRLGTDEVIRIVGETFLDQEWSWQLYASSVFRYVKSEEAVRVAAPLLQQDSLDDEIKQFLADGLANQFSTEALECLVSYLESGADWFNNYEWTETLSSMEVAAKLLDYPLPKLDQWRADLTEASQSDRASWFTRWQDAFEDDDQDDFLEDDDDFVFERPVPAETIVYEAPLVGRNDPCPCGSGKKFKKCCLNKNVER